MRLALLLLICACGKHAFDPCDPIAPDAPSSGLVAHYAFDSDGLLLDRSPGAHPATCSSVCPLEIGGRVGDGAASFDGTSCLHIPDAFDLRPSMFTFAAWVTPAGPTVKKTAFSRPFMNDNTPNTFALYVEINSTAGVEVNGTNLRAGALTSWHHIAGTFDNASLTLFVDGIASAGPLLVGAAPYSSVDLRIGCEKGGVAEEFFFFGAIDDVRLYERVLDVAEIAELAAM